MRRLGCSVALVACLLGAPRGASANPLDAFGFGSRETAMGGAAAAATSGVAAGYYNPAGLARTRGLELSLGYVHANHRLETAGEDADVDTVRGWNGGLVAPGRVLGIPFAFGVGLHLPDGRLSRVRALPQDQPRWELHDNRNQRLWFAANVALEPFPWLAIGGGISFMSATRGRIDIGGSANVLQPDGSLLRHEVEADLLAVRYPQAGIRVALGDRAALAVVYRGEFQLGLDLSAHLFADVSGLTTALYDLRARSVANFLPQQVVLGGSWDLGARLRTTFDATWIDWSAYVPPIATLDVQLDIPPPPNGWPVGVTPPQAPVPTAAPELVMKDRIVPRAGLEWHALGEGKTRAFVRAGYEVARSPLVPQPRSAVHLDRDRHSFSLGLGITLEDVAAELPATIFVDAHGQLGVLPEGDTAGVTGGGTILNLGLTTGLRFR